MVLHHIALTAKDIADSANFYSKLLGPLGYSMHSCREDFCSLHGPAPEILLYLADEQFMKEKNHIYGPGLHHLAFKVESPEIIDRLFGISQTIDATVLDKPTKYPNYAEDYYALFLLDPNGSKIEFMYSSTI